MASPSHIPWTQKPPLGVPVDWGNPITQGLVLVTIMNEGSGDKVYDLSGYGNTGTLTNMDPATDWDGGPDSWALDFDGSGDHVLVSSSPSLSIAGNATVLARVRPDTAGFRGIYGSGNAEFREAQALYVLNTSRFQAVFNSGEGTAFQVASTTVYDTGTWYSVAGTLELGVGISIYVDGQLEDTSLAFSSRAFSPGDVLIGDMLDVSPLNGQIAYVMVWDRALSADEVKSLYENPWQIIQPRRLWVPGAAAFNPYYYNYMNRMFAEG